jgi:uncharacterized membrane protein YcaP (DUF421 family)
MNRLVLRVLGMIGLFVALAAPMALVASWRRGYLPGIVALMALVVVTQIVTAMGAGAWFPYAAPALWMGMGGAAAALVLLSLNFLLAEVSGINRRFRKMIQGSPTLLIHNGQCLTPHMAKEHISMDELERALREHGVACAADAALAVLEVDGSISVLKYDDVPDQARPQKRLKFLHRN